RVVRTRRRGLSRMVAGVLAGRQASVRGHALGLRLGPAIWGANTLIERSEPGGCVAQWTLVGDGKQWQQRAALGDGNGTAAAHVPRTPGRSEFNRVLARRPAPGDRKRGLDGEALEPARGPTHPGDEGARRPRHLR